MSIETILHNTYFPLAGLIMGIAGIIWGVISHFRSKKKKIPVFEIEQRTLIRNDEPILPGLKVSFNNSPQGLITVAHVRFWNRGREIMNASDVADPLLLRVRGGAKVLSAQVIKATQPSNKSRIGDFSTELYHPGDADGPEIFDESTRISYIENTIIPLSFDFLEKGDGMLIQIVHNGEDNHGIGIEGKIKGVSNIKMNHPRRKLFSKWHSFAPILMILTVIATFQFTPVQLAETNLVNLLNRINQFEKSIQSAHLVGPDEQADYNALISYMNATTNKALDKIKSSHKVTRYVAFSAGFCYIIYEILYWFLSFAYNIPKKLRTESID